MKPRHGYADDEADRRLDLRKVELDVGELLTECESRAAEQNRVLRVENTHKTFEGVYVIDPALCIEAVLKSVETMSMKGRYPVSAFIQPSLERSRKKNVEIIIASDLNAATSSGWDDDLRIAARSRVLKIWLQENGVLARDRGGVDSDLSVRLVFAVSPQDEQECPLQVVPACNSRILLVENCEETCILLARQLRDWGYAVAEAHSSEQAIQILDTEPGFEYGVFDLNLPGLSGEQLAAYCRGQDDLKGLKLIAISGEDLNPNSGLFDSCLAKPFRPVDLKRTLEAISPSRSFEALRSISA